MSLARAQLDGAARETGGRGDDEELKTEWSQAGIKTDLTVVNREDVVQDFEAGKWQAVP